MSIEHEDKNWKLKLRYGRLKTPYKHCTAIGEGVAGELIEGFSCRRGSAFMAMKMWASSAEEATDMTRVIGEQIGFSVTGRTYIYDTEPDSPPGDKPRGYDIKFTPFDAE